MKLILQFMALIFPELFNYEIYIYEYDYMNAYKKQKYELCLRQW